MHKLKLKKYTMDYKNKYKGVRKRKIFVLLLVLMVISLIVGILYLAVVDKASKLLVKNTVFEYIKSLSSKTYNYQKELIMTLKSNVILTIIMWFLGVSLFGSIFEIIFLIVKSFTLGFSISSIIYTFKIKGIYVGLIYLLPSIFNMIIYFILGFFAINFSIYLYKYLFKGVDVSLKRLMKKYLKVLIISLILLIISSLIEVFLVPNVLKLFTKSIF